MKIEILLLLVTMIASVIGNCSEGCMKCNKLAESCFICDSISGYYFNAEGVCVNNQIAKCITSSQGGDCLLCQKEHYYDGTQKLCVSLEKDQLIKHCMFYKAPGICQVCQKDYYLKGDKCIDVEFLVQGCEIYDSNGLCMACEIGSILHPDRKRCVRIDEDKNCLLFGYLRCDQCQKGFALDYSYFIDGILTDNNFDRTLTLDILNGVAVEKRQAVGLVTPCRELDIRNCEDYDKENKCTKCADFFFLSNNRTKCEAFPLPTILNCDYYSNYNECVRCAQGFLLASPYECQKIEPIEKCLLYAQDIAANVCIGCEEGLYVNGNACTERQMTIENCTLYDPLSDSCMVCGNNQRLTTDNQKCLPPIFNCKRYNDSNASNTSFTCLECNDKYVLMSDSGNCDIGDVPNCKRYGNNDSLNCLVCENEFYLDGQDCKPHEPIRKCSIYSPEQNGICLRCDNTSFLTTQVMGCGLIKTNIPSCLTYESPSRCALCDSGYHLTNGLCEIIPAEEHCLEKNINSQCVLCASGFLLSNHTCHHPLEAYLANCEKIKNDGISSEFECEYCRKNTIPYNHEGTYVCQDPSRLDGDPIAHCIKYRVESGEVFCDRCAPGFYLTNENGCIDKEAAYNTGKLTYNIVKTELLENNRARVITRQAIFSDAGSDCQIAVSDIHDGKACLKCKEYAIPVEKRNSEVLIDPNAEDYDIFEISPQMVYRGFNCADSDGLMYWPGDTSEPPENCAEFRVDDGDAFCTRCKHGYTGTVGTQGENRYQNCNIQIDDCKNDVIYGGLKFSTDLIGIDLPMFDFFTCHSCYTQNKIPVLFVNEGSSIKDFLITDSNQNPLDSGIGPNSYITQCLEIKPESFGYRKENFINKFPDHCALATYEITHAKQYKGFVGEIDVPLRCVACKPGYKAVIVNQVIVSCIAIENCNNGHEGAEWLNSCSKCKAGFNWAYDLQSELPLFNVCTKSPDPNCAFRSSMPSQLNQSEPLYPLGQCVFCKQGYSLNYDRICERLESPFCKEGQFVKETSVLGNNLSELNYKGFLFNKYGNGCNECEAGYVSIKEMDTNYICIDSPYLREDRFLPETVYNKNCRNYAQRDGRLVCGRCNDGFVISEEGDYCISEKVVTDCLMTSINGETCIHCRESFVLVDGFCERENIKNCKDYDQGLNYQKCLSCIDTYKLVNRQCIKGHVKQCMIYDDEERCVECQAQFVLGNLDRGKQKCLPLVSSLNCDMMDTEEFNQHNRLYCNVCKEGYAQLDDQSAFDEIVCVDIIETDKCVNYDIGTALEVSSLQCWECEENFYLRNEICRPRNKSTTNCIEYSLTDDFCVECGNGFYLSNEKDCKPFPTGIFGCIDYVTHTECGACDKGTFLNGTSCTVVTQVVPNCDYYSDNGVCRECKFTYYLTEDNTCVKAKALNCKTYERIDRCSSCLEDFGLMQQEDGQINCIHIDVPNCSKSSKEYPFNCYECNSLFYLENNVCLPIEKAIEGCFKYDSVSTCQRCQSNRVLSLDKQQCIYKEEETDLSLSPYQNCLDNKITLRPLCNVCKPGYRMVKGVCTECTVHTKEEGCMFCSGDKKEICHLCLPGYYQTTAGDCKPNQRTLNERN